ncbi:hypothetical protein GCM10022217_19460 [Chryseobacterium ginsenosidimutans]
MFSSFENKPDAQKVIADDSAACRENITQRIMDSVEIGFAREKVGKGSTEELKAPDFHNSTQSTCNNEEQNLFLA